MSDSSKAVFLSYASQDAEAAKRICDALRAAGIEVWFDQNELVGGDAWDQKIRKQIASCALFVPIISANTQARAEGYFRLEWRLADRRTDLIGKSKAFLLPVCIDDTRDSEADVPDSFLAVQWTKMPAGEVPPAFVARVQRLLERSSPTGRAGPETFPSTEPPAATPPAGSGAGKPRAKWVWPVVASAVLVIAALAVSLARRSAGSGAEDTPPAAPAAGAGEAGRAELARLRQRVVPDRWQREDFLALRPEFDRLIAQHPDLADAWALRSIIHSLQVARSYDYGTQPLLAGKEDADRALRLAPGSPLGELALGLHYTAMLIRGGDPAVARTHVDRALRVLPRDSLTRYADIVSNWLGYRFDETEQGAKRWLEEEPDNVFPCWVLAQSTLVRRQAAEARRWSEATIAKGSGITWVRGFYTLAECEYYLAGDLVAARRALERVPAEFRSIHRLVYGFWLQACAEEKPDLALQELNRLPDPILADRNFHGPKAVLAALAHRQASRAGAADIQFAEAEKTLRQMLAADPDNEVLHAILAFTLAGLGRGDAARAELALIEPLIAGRPPGVYIGHLHSWLAQTYLELNDVPAFLPWFRKLVAGPSVNPFTAASLRVDPRFKRALALPEVQALLAVLSTPELTEIGRLLGNRTSIGINRAELTTEKIRLLDELARKAITATPDNAEAWAVAAEIDYLQYLTGRDRSRERQAQMNQRMLRAVELDAQSFDVRWIKMAVLSRTAQTPAAWQDLENQLLALQRERPDHEGTLAAVASGKTWSGQTQEGAAMLMKLRLHDEAFWAYMRAGDWAHAEEAARKRMEMPDCLHEGLFFLGFVLVNGREDPDAALAALEQLPLAARVEDRFAQMLWWLHMLRRDPDNAMVALAGLPQEWVGSAPVAHFRASAHHLAGRNEASQIEWRQALAQVEQRLSATPNNTDLLRIKALILADLGQTAEALRVGESERQLSARPVDDLSRSLSVQLLAGNKEPVLRWLERELPKRSDLYLRSMVRYSEHFDTLRGDPRFEKLIRDTLPPGSKPFDESKPLGRQ